MSTAKGQDADEQDPLAGSARPMDLFGGAAVALAGSIRKIATNGKGAEGGADAIRSAAQGDTTVLRGIKGQAAAAETSVAAAGRSSGTAGGGLRGALTRINGVRGSLAGVATGVGGALALLATMVPALAPVQSFLDKFGTALLLGSIAVTAINLVMKANPLGFVTGVLLPLAAYLIDLALNSETGQKIMQQVASFVMQGIPALLKILSPVLKIVATVVATYFSLYLTVIIDVLKVLNVLVGTGFQVMNALLTGHVGRLRGIASNALGGIKDAVRPVTDWFTKHIPDAFTRVKNAMSKTLNAAGGFLETGAQTVVSVARAPIQGLIGFANFVIRGLNKIHFSFFGKGFGVHLSQIPMLAGGGVVLPGSAPYAARVLPLTALDRQLALAASARSTPSAAGTRRVQQYRETSALGPRGTAEELLFLAAAPAA